jgi:Spy/CpxP family protein refolding chaperone
VVNATRTKIYAALAAVFALGAVAGGAAVYAYTRSDYALLAGDDSGELRERRRFVALSRELRLDDAQGEKVRSILLRYRPERRRLVRATFEQCGKAVDEQKAKMDSEIRSLLRPEQKPRFETLLQAQRQHSPFWSK